MNLEIKSEQVRLVDENGEMLGVVPTQKALSIAYEKGLDLIEVSPNAAPPVCKLLDAGKYKYELQKKLHEAKKKQKVVEIKEIKVRPNIAQNDYDVKIKSVVKFLNEGNKVKVTLRFKGREATHPELGFNLLKKMYAEVAEIGKIEQDVKFEGRQLLMVIGPVKL